MSTLWFQHSSEMRASFYQAFNIATLMLEKHIAELPSGKTAAVVIDIDETILDNSPFQGQVIMEGTPYSQPFWEEWTRLAIAEPLPGALDFLNSAKELGAEVFYVSNRKETERESTLMNLKEKGFPFAENKFLILRTEESSKEARRQKIAETHEIVLLIGDNLNDLAVYFEDRYSNMGYDAVDKHRNEFGNRYIVLPNPMYGEWERPFFKDLNNPDENEKNEARKNQLRLFR